MTAPGLWRKLWAGDAARKSRLHDEMGRMVSARLLLRHAPQAVGGALLRLTTGRLPKRPWISYEAQNAIERLCASRPVRMLEFGSGQSTLWYAGRAAELISIENDRGWHRHLAPKLTDLEHVAYRLAESQPEYAEPEVEGQFDVIMIDGAWRDDCAQFAAAHLAPGGAIYLDNSDKGAGGTSGDVPRARALLIDFAEANGLPWREITDFAPAQAFVQRGLMVGGAA